MIIQYLSFLAEHIIELMLGLLTAALMFRYFAYKLGQRNHNYFGTFSKTVDKLLQSEDKQKSVDNVENWLKNLLEKVVKELPSRSLRIRGAVKGSEKSFRHTDRQSELFVEFAEGKKSLSHAIQRQVDAFKSPHSPNFYELTTRILDSDKKWKYLFGFIPVNTLSSLLNILPGLFIVAGIFGTFVGITAALPKVAQIDLNNLEQAAPLIASFVDDVAYSMHTSIAGILCSVVMTILNTIFPFHSIRNDVQRNVSRCLELIWYRIHGTKVSAADAQIISLLEKIHLQLGGKNENGKLKKVS